MTSGAELWRTRTRSKPMSSQHAQDQKLCMQYRYQVVCQHDLGTSEASLAPAKSLSKPADGITCSDWKQGSSGPVVRSAMAGCLTIAVSLAFAAPAFCSVSIIILCKDAGHWTKMLYCLQVMPASVRMVRKACSRLNARARPKGLTLQPHQVKVQEPISHRLALLLTWMIW